MRRARAILPALATAIAMGLVTDADACSRPWRNLYADFGLAPGAREVREARYVDWVEIVAKGPPACQRDRAWTDADREKDDNAQPPSATVSGDPDAPAPDAVAVPRSPNLTAEGYQSRSCSDRDRTGPLYALEARVIESLKGAGPSSFPLAYGWSAENPPDRAYSDPRTAMVEIERQLPTSYAEGLARHARPGFVDHGELHEDRDATDSCGGEPTAMVGGRYVAFRSASGAVMALEPATDRDDPWFDRVRRFSTDPNSFTNPRLEVADFFRASSGVAIVRVKSCPGRRNTRRRARILVQLRSSMLTSEQLGLAEDFGSSFWIPDYLQRIGAPCRAGMELLLISGPFDDDGSSPPRAARIDRAMIRTSDLLSGYRLTGPEIVTLLQVFAWVDEGQGARRPAL